MAKKKASKKKAVKRKASRKRPARKTPAKKVVRKKTGKPRIQQKKAIRKRIKSKKKARIKNASDEEVFILCNGHKLKNVKELADVMKDIEDHIFNYHVTPDKNDFENWVRDVFKDISLAKKLGKVKNKDKVKLVIYKHIGH